MSKKNPLTLIVAVLWLINNLFCFCWEEGLAKTIRTDAAPCASCPSHSSSESPSDGCSPCCGNQVCAIEIPAEISSLSPQGNFYVEILTSSEQLNFRSIYHPPKA
jgi:hypothetical protein